MKASATADRRPHDRDHSKRAARFAAARTIFVLGFVGSTGIETVGAAYIAYLLVRRRPLPSWATHELTRAERIVEGAGRWLGLS